ncbi:hypothetical protein P5673_002242 [Acropora cervicornis]|uniref:Uncharacterized protein n=1 Tax=Acropora cervicornis TaxID=6130 RepID=A0AAD9R531_ACRCE|nr:hypothetical protein P5673_002242 [Acropora cervicornis]
MKKEAEISFQSVGHLILKNEAHSPDDSDMTLVILCVTSLHRYIVNAGEGERVREEEFNRSVRLGKRDTEGLKRKQKESDVDAEQPRKKHKNTSRRTTDHSDDSDGKQNFHRDDPQIGVCLQYLSTNDLIEVYCCFIRPVLEDAVPVWASLPSYLSADVEAFKVILDPGTIAIITSSKKSTSFLYTREERKFAMNLLRRIRTNHDEEVSSEDNSKSSTEDSRLSSSMWELVRKYIRCSSRTTIGQYNFNAAVSTKTGLPLTYFCKLDSM